MKRIAGSLLLAVLLLGGLPAAGAGQSNDALAARASEGSAAMQASHFDEAAAIYAELVAKKPGDAGLLMNLGMARYMAGDPSAALAPLQKAARLKPSLAPASLFLGAALLDLGRPSEAVAPLQRAVAALPGNAQAREMLARSELALDRYPAAVGSYEVLTRLTPEDPKAWYGSSRAYQGIAERAFATLEQRAPDSPLLELLVADVAVTEDKFAAALATYRRVLGGSPPVGGIHSAIADLYQRAGKPQWAAAERQKARPLSPERCATRRAECAFLQGKPRDALRAAAGSQAPADLYWTIRAANALATMAVARLETLPPSIELHLIRAEIAQSRGRRPDAVSEIREALALAPGDPTIEAALGEALLRAQSSDEAVPLLERLAREQPDNADVQFLYGDALLESQQVERAVQALERAVKADPSSVRARGALGQAYLQAGKYQQAVEQLEHAAPDDTTGDIHYQLARAYQALGRVDDARGAMAEYQKRHPAPSPPTEEAEPVLTPPE